MFTRLFFIANTKINVITKLQNIRSFAVMGQNLERKIFILRIN